MEAARIRSAGGGGIRGLPGETIEPRRDGFATRTRQGTGSDKCHGRSSARG